MADKMYKKENHSLKSRRSVSCIRNGYFQWIFFKEATALKPCAALKNEYTHPTYNVAMLRLHVKGKVFNSLPLCTLLK